MKSVSDIEQVIEKLETRNAFQDDVIEQLNHELSIHQSEIAEIKQQLSVIAKRLKENTAAPQGKEEIEPPPPHY